MRNWALQARNSAHPHAGTQSGWGALTPYVSSMPGCPASQGLPRHGMDWIHPQWESWGLCQDSDSFRVAGRMYTPTCKSLQMCSLLCCKPEGLRGVLLFKALPEGSLHLSAYSYQSLAWLLAASPSWGSARAFEKIFLWWTSPPFPHLLLLCALRRGHPPLPPACAKPLLATPAPWRPCPGVGIAWGDASGTAGSSVGCGPHVTNVSSCMLQTAATITSLKSSI